MFGKIISIDGPSNTGKSTICENISRYPQFEYIKESGRRVKHPRPSTNLEEEILNQIFYFKEEEKRIEEAYNLASQGKFVILDRSVLSILSIAYAFEKVGKYQAFSNAKALYEKFNEKMISPDMYIFLEAKPIDLQKRNKSVKLPPSWMNDTFIGYQIEFNRNISNKLNNSFILSTSDRQIDDLINEIINYALQKNDISANPLIKFHEISII